MSQNYSLELQARSEVGRGASRRLRHAGQVPGIIYGGKGEPQQFSVAQNVIMKCLEDEGFYTNIITLTVEGKKQKALLKDLQRHPFKRMIMHADFQRVSDEDVLHRNVPLHFLNEEIAVGVKQDGGTIFRQLKEVEVVCKAKDLPEYIEVDLENLKLNQTLHLSDLTLSKGVKLASLELGDDHNLPVVAVKETREAVEPEVEVETPAADGTTDAETKEGGE